MEVDINCEHSVDFLLHFLFYCTFSLSIVSIMTAKIFTFSSLQRSMHKKRGPKHGERVLLAFYMAPVIVQSGKDWLGHLGRGI